MATNEDLDLFLLNVANQSLETFNYQYLTAASALGNGTILAWFNNQFYHTASLALDLVHNAIIRAIINPAYSIHVVNAPFDFLIQPNSTQEDDAKISAFGITLTFTVSIALSMVSSSYIMFYIQVKKKFLFFATSIHSFPITGKSMSC